MNMKCTYKNHKSLHKIKKNAITSLVKSSRSNNLQTFFWNGKIKKDVFFSG